MSERELDKPSIARLLEEIQDEITQTMTSLNRIDAVLTLLCLEDAYDDAEQNIFHKIMSERFTQNSKMKLMDLQNVYIQTEVHIFEAIAVALKHGIPYKRSLPCLPRTKIAYFMDLEWVLPSGEHRVETFSRYDDSERARAIGWKPGDLVVSGRVFTPRYLQVDQWEVVEQGITKKLDDYVKKTDDVIMLLRRKTLLEMARKYKIPVALDDGGTLHTKYDVDSEVGRFLTSQGMSLRDIQTRDINATIWAGETREAAKQSIRTISYGRESIENRLAIEGETAGYMKTYSKFPGFATAFRQSRGYSYTELIRMCQAMIDLSRPGTNSVFIGAPKKTVEELSKRSGLAPLVVRRIADSITWREGSEMVRFPILNVDGWVVFSMVGALRPLFGINYFFNDYYSTDIKGRVFEDRCRAVLKDGGFEVFPDRLYVPYQMIPDGVCLRIFGQVKKSTDLDVLARRDEVILLVECKERKSIAFSGVHRQNEFRNFVTELQHKALWMSEHTEIVTELCGNHKQLVRTNDGPLYLVPLLVSNDIVDLPFDTPILQLTYTELKHLAEDRVDLKIEKHGEIYELNLEAVLPNPPNRTEALAWPRARAGLPTVG